MEQVLESTQLIYSARRSSSRQLLIKCSEKHEEMRPVSTNLNEGKYKLYTGHSQCTYLQMLAIRRIS